MPAFIIVMSIWMLGVIGGIANVVQCVWGMMALEQIGTMSGLLLFKIVSIFLGPVGSVMGWIGMF